MSFASCYIVLKDCKNSSLQGYSRHILYHGLSLATHCLLGRVYSSQRPLFTASLSSSLNMPFHRPHLSSLLSYRDDNPSDDRTNDYAHLDHAAESERARNELQSDLATFREPEPVHSEDPGSDHESLADQQSSDEESAEDEDEDESEEHKFLTSNPSCESSFEYKKPLHHHDDKRIRLFTLEPGKGYDEIHCEIAEYPLNKAPAYETVSYFWGGRDSKSSIALSKRVPLSNKLRSYKVLRTPRNLKLALKYLRDENKPRVIWADAICINQDDKDEKTQQVGMLLDIYQRASQVVVWLGTCKESDAGPNQAFELCEHIVANEGKVELGLGFHLYMSRNEMERKSKIYKYAVQETYQGRKPPVTANARQKIERSKGSSHWFTSPGGFKCSSTWECTLTCSTSHYSLTRFVVSSACQALII